MITFSKHTLLNGLRVIEAPMHETNAMAVLVLVGVGSRYERKEIAGVSHFLEHMFFKGTVKRPSYLDVSKELDALGAEYNAFTGQEYTGYFIHASADQFDESLDILSDMLLQGTLSETEVQKEKGVITEELNMYWDMPQSAVAETVDTMLYAPNQLGTPIGGTKQTVATMTRKKLLDYKNRSYVPKNMVIVAAGNPKQSNWKKSIEGYFGALVNRPQPRYQPMALTQRKPQLKVISRKTDQAHFVVAWHGLKRADPRRPALKVLNTILGGMMSSWLFDEIREKRGLAYYVRSGFDDFHDTGSFYARAGVMVGKVQEAIKVTLDTIEKLKHKPVTAAELVRAKEHLKGHLYLGLENSFAVAEFLAEQELLWEEIKQPEEIVKKVQAVTANDIMSLAKELVTPAHLNIGVIGPYDSDSSFQTLIK